MPPGPGWGEREVHREGAAMDAKSQSPEAMALEVLDLVNRHRKTLGMPALRLSPIESSVAQKHSSEMASGKTPFGHDGLQQRIDVISRQIGPLSAEAENVAFGPRDAKSVVDMWLKSQLHRGNMEGAYTLTGIGVSADRQGRLYFTQIFTR